jgi:hypothetical protein
MGGAGQNKPTPNKGTTGKMAKATQQPDRQHLNKFLIIFKSWHGAC